MNNALGNALMIEVLDLLSQMKVFEERRAPIADAQTVVGVGDGNTLASCQRVTALRPNRSDRFYGSS
jgi:hypothetical protein